jgi:hypothetical protein
MAVRNQILHGEGEISGPGTYSEKLWFIELSLDVLMKACFLRELGFTENERESLIGPNSWRAYLVDFARKRRQARS